MYGLFSEYVNINPESKIRKFKVLKSFEINDWCVYEGDVISLAGNILRTSDGHYLAHISYYPIEVLFNNDCIEEILPDEKLISSEENTNIKEDIYSRKYNIYEILTLIPNLPKDSRFKCSLDDRIWESFIDQDLVDEEGYVLSAEFSLKEVLDATYTLVKPIEEVGEKWVEIETHRDLCSAIVNKKMIRLGDGKAFNNYNDQQIETLFGALERGVLKLEYLEEN